MHDPRTLRAQQLLEQSRYSEAEKELRNLLSAAPDDQHLLSMLALALSGLEQYAESEALIQRCIAMAPGESWFLYMYGDILLQQHRYQEAEEMARRAITMSPEEANYRGLLASSLLARKHYEEALAEADAGLALQADNLTCLNLRSTILITMGRKEEGFAAIDQALEQDPENSHTHANYGWHELHRGDHRKALPHFREALRYDPENDYAKAGLVQALQARYLVYRWFLKYYFWMSRMQGGVQWAVIIGFYVGQQLLGSLAEKYPALEPFIFPVIILYMVFALSSWIIQPLFNLFLRLNPYGRYALSKRQTQASNFLGIALGAGTVAGIAYLFTQNAVLGNAALVCLVAMLPLGTMLTPSQKRDRVPLVMFALALLGVGLGGVISAGVTGEAFNPFMIMYLIGIFAYQWVANFMMSRS